MANTPMIDVSNMICLFDGQVHLPESYKSEKHQHPYEAFRLTRIYITDITIKFLSDELIRVILDIFTDKSDIRYSVDKYHESGHLTTVIECINKAGKNALCFDLLTSTSSYERGWRIYSNIGKSYSGDHREFENTINNNVARFYIPNSSGYICQYSIICMNYRDINYYARLGHINSGSNLTIRYITSENRLLQSQLDVLSSKFDSLQLEMQEMRRSMAISNNRIDQQDTDDDGLIFLDANDTQKSDKDTQTELTMSHLSKLDTILDLIK